MNMTAIDLVQTINGDTDVIEINLKNEKRVLLTVDKNAILKIGEHYITKLKFRFITASAFESKEGIEILYHFSKDSTGLIATIRVVLPKDNPTIDSLASKYEAFNWIEREMHELLGIVFTCHPKPEKLVSDGNWEEGTYPFRKS
jgi:NADH-quinone oxidoreductase subunit C